MYNHTTATWAQARHFKSEKYKYHKSKKVSGKQQYIVSFADHMGGNTHIHFNSALDISDTNGF